MVPAVNGAESGASIGTLSSFPSLDCANGDVVLSPKSPPRQPSHTLTGSDSFAPSLASKPSSLSMQRSIGTLDGRLHASNRRLKSQYPREHGESHVEFILVARFDIDKGSMMEHQYPGPISGDETMLAELMLPDQAHNRKQDWTIFFLHKDTSNEGEDGSPPGPDVDGDNDSPDDQDDDEQAEEMLEGPPLIYVLNHVHTERDETVKRGAVCRAMAICTRHSFVDVFKPVLIMAMEQYYKSPTWDTLADLYDSLNSMDLSLMPRLTVLERMILQASNAKDMFIEKFQRMIQQRKEREQQAAVSNNSSAEEVAPQNQASRFTLPKDTHEYESHITYQRRSIPVKVPTAKSVETVGNFSIISLIKTFSEPHASAPQPFALHAHLTTSGAYTHPIIVLVNALLTQKRVVFLGHGKPSEEVAAAVLAACSLVSGGVLRGFTRHAFPYTDLTKIEDLQKVPGFIAGVTNPVFAGNQRWWDLLCDLPTGRMKISNEIEHPQQTEGAKSFQLACPNASSLANGAPGAQTPDSTGDLAFMENVLKSMSNRLGEGYVRRMWREWIDKFTRITAVFEEQVYGTSALYIGGEQADEGDFGISGHGFVWPDETSKARELSGNVNRIEGWRVTRSYYNYKQDLIQLYNCRPIKTIDLNHHFDRLRTQRLSPDESAAIYAGFSAAVYTEAEICQLLVTTSESNGGLFYIALGLLHPRREVRFKTVELLERIARHEAGKHYWNSLTRFFQMAFFRQRREMETTAGRSESELSKVASLSEMVAG